MNIAAIDIGSNAIRLVIAKKETSGEITFLKRMRVPLRLGKEAFSKSKTFSSSTLKLAGAVFKSFSELLKEYHS